MLIAFIFRLVSLMGVATGVVADDVRDEVITSPRVARVRLAETLASADSIHSVSARAGKITFAISRGNESFDVVATTAKRGEVASLSITRASANHDELGSLSWLSSELAGVTAISRLVVDEDGAVTITTSSGTRYMVIPGRGSGGTNAGVEARWAAEWNHT
jgi:hypothetical protein